MAREADVVRSLVEMADTLVDDYDVVDLLTGVADRCVSLLGVSAAGVMLASPAGSLGLAASSSQAMRLLELFELQAQEGPCLDAFRTGERVDHETLDAGSGRWPSFSGPGGALCSCRPTAGPAGPPRPCRRARGSRRPAGPAHTRAAAGSTPAWRSSAGRPGDPGATARSPPGRPACRRGFRRFAAAPGRPWTASGPDAWRSPARRTRRRGRSRAPHARRPANNGPNAAGR